MDETELVFGFTKWDCPKCQGTGIAGSFPGSFPGIAGVSVQCDCMYMTREEANQQIVDAARARNATNGFPDEYILLFDEIREQWELIMFSTAIAQRLATRAASPGPFSPVSSMS
jgi:hypothetical protein